MSVVASQQQPTKQKDVDMDDLDFEAITFEEESVGLGFFSVSVLLFTAPGLATALHRVTPFVYTLLGGSRRRCTPAVDIFIVVSLACACDWLRCRVSLCASHPTLLCSVQQRRVAKPTRSFADSSFFFFVFFGVFFCWHAALSHILVPLHVWRLLCAVTPALVHWRAHKISSRQNCHCCVLLAHHAPQ